MSTAEISKRKHTPPEIAAMYGISVDKVMAWILSGDLRAINSAVKGATRPRYLVDVDDLAAFEESRLVVPDTPRKRRRRSGEKPRFFPHK